MPTEEVNNVTRMYRHFRLLYLVHQPMPDDPITALYHLHHLRGMSRELEMDGECLLKTSAQQARRWLWVILLPELWATKLNAILEHGSPELKNQARVSILATLKQCVKAKHIQYNNSLRNMKALLSLCVVPLRV